MRRNLYKITHNKDLHVGVNKINFSHRRYDTASQRQPLHGFTLIELLVVIAIIALLLAIIMPALDNAKRLATAVVCMSNVRGLSQCWYLYTEDNDSWIMDGDTGDTADGWQMKRNRLVHLFTPDPQDVNGNISNTSVEDKIRGFKKGAVWPYMENYKLFNCRSDTRWRKEAVDGYARYKNGVGGKCIGGYRSYSMGAPLSRQGLDATSTREDLCVIEKQNEFINPSSKIIWLEEADGAGINHRTWNMFLGHKEWWDPFTIWHNGSSTFGFADSHAERHKWVEKETIEMCENQTKRVVVPAGKERDYDWFWRSYIPGKIPAGLMQ